MSENIRSTNLRFNLEKDTQKRAWQYLQNMDKQQFKSYSNVIAVALVDYFQAVWWECRKCRLEPFRSHSRNWMRKWIGIFLENKFAPS